VVRVVERQPGPSFQGPAVFAKARPACCQVCTVVNSTGRSGSGCYIEMEPGKVVFMTAAHCVVDRDDTTHGVVLASSIYVQDPASDRWVSVPTENVVYDGVADVAFCVVPGVSYDPLPMEDTQKFLRLAGSVPAPGSRCFVFGNPAAVDEDSISEGIVRDGHYCEPSGSQKTDSIFVTCPAVGGNSGGPVLDEDGEVVGIYTFGMNETESFGGGSNVDVLREVWAAEGNKRFLGLQWHIPAALELSHFYQSLTFPVGGAVLEAVHPLSPFKDKVEVGSLLLGFEFQGSFVRFGNLVAQRSPGVMYYLPENAELGLRFLVAGGGEQQTSVVLGTGFAEVDGALDMFLSKTWAV
jgi:hypothetical protein